MDAQEIKDRIKWYHEEAYVKGNTAVNDEYFAPDLKSLDWLTGEKGGLEELKRNMEGLTNFSDIHFAIDDIVVEGNRAAYRWVASAKDAQGKVGHWGGISVHTFIDGKVAEDYFIGGEVKA